MGGEERKKDKEKHEYRSGIRNRKDKEDKGIRGGKGEEMFEKKEKKKRSRIGRRYIK